MTQPINVINQLQQQLRNLYRLLYGVLAFAALALWFMHDKAANLNLHMAPNLRAGEVVEVRDGVATAPPVNVYGFAFYVWQQVNRWPKDGSRDYGQQIYAMQNYLTPRCHEWLKANMNQKAGSGELSGRTRALHEMLGRGYAPNRVVTHGESTGWTVLLDMQLVETMKGQTIKDAYLRYPVSVVRYAIDLKRNPYQLAIDCNDSSTSQRLDAPPEGAASAPLGAEIDRAAARIEPAPLPPTSNPASGEPS